jgi:endonuclease/exonuclease/phosphatase family metal-dependent hydrolase
VRVATFNLHAGVDGWGRTTAVLETIAALDADLLVLPELWRGEDEDMFGELSDRLGLVGAFAPLATGLRAHHATGGRGWQPVGAHFTGERVLLFDEHRDLTRTQSAHRARVERLEPGTWGLALLTRLPVDSSSVVPLGRMAREKVERALVVARLRVAGRPFTALALHGAHLSHGSPSLYRRVGAYVAGLDPSEPVILAGDFNCWRPLLRALLPGWRTLARGRTWPAYLPHSQIDHVLGRGPWRSRRSWTVDGGSDHRALACEVELGAP